VVGTTVNDDDDYDDDDDKRPDIVRGTSRAGFTRFCRDRCCVRGLI